MADGSGAASTGTVAARLAELGITLPDVAAPVAAYVPAVRTGRYVYTSGQLPFVDGALPATDLALFVSGRASFEIVQKAWAAGFGAVVAVSAPSALAVQTAARAGITLCGFVRGASLNIYA